MKGQKHVIKMGKSLTSLCEKKHRSTCVRKGKYMEWVKKVQTSKWRFGSNNNEAMKKIYKKVQLTLENSDRWRREN